MEVDVSSSEVSTPSETQVDAAAVGLSGRDEIDVYLDAPVP